MDKGYEVYCFADPLFYDSPTVTRGDDVDFDVARSPVPEGWERSELDDWLVYAPNGVRLPPQGWKIHASASVDTAEETLAAVWDYCVPRRIPFKFVRSRQLYFIRNMKYSHRGGSGKLVTIYPEDDVQLEIVLSELGSLVDGRPGPYILSDLRWGAGPLYVRYGGFAERYCVGPNGELVPAIADPSGRLVPDRREATFHVPLWVTLPDFLAPHLAARNSTTVDGLPYRFEGALHFSNGGGLYTAVDERSGERVVLKEGRPHAGLSASGADAVARLQREQEMLQRLAGLDVVPAVKDHFTLGDHHFLVMELVDGRPLSSVLVERYPLITLGADEARLAEFTSWALDVCDRVERAVAEVHGRGVVLGDLHPSNVLVRPDGRIVLIDLEVAASAAEARQTLAAPGFVAPADRRGFDIDRFALACLRLHLFLPLTALIGLEPRKVEQFAGEIAQIFPVPEEFLAEAVQVIAGGGPGSGHDAGAERSRPPRLETDPASWRRARDSMAQAILLSASPDRDDRLFPGDIRQFDTGGLNVAHGAAGVLYALAVCGAGRHPDHEAWLLRRAMSPPPGTRLGFYDGLHGVAHVLDVLGRRGDALALLGMCNDDLAGRWDRLGVDLYAGLAGIGLNLVHFATATGDASLWDAAWQVADAVAERLGDEDGVADVSGGQHPYAGLLRGSSGPALMFIRLYEHSGDPELLDLAATALRQDLRRCVRIDDGSLEVNEGWRTMPYLADGSVGIGLVLDDYLTHRDDEEFAEAAAAIHGAAAAQFYIEPGLFYGRAGMILYLSRRGLGGGAPDPIVASHVRRLAWHALGYRGHLAFPGEQLLRLSMDLATGTAGVLLAVGAALHGDPVHLPFLGPPHGLSEPHGEQLIPTTERR